MALNKAALKAEIIQLLNDLKSAENQDAAIEAYADGMAEAFDKFVKSGETNTPTGVAVQVNTGTGTGATTAPGIGTIS